MLIAKNSKTCKPARTATDYEKTRTNVCLYLPVISVAVLPYHFSIFSAYRTMLEHILQLDQRLFYFINHDLANPVFDVIMPILRNRYTWIPLYIFLVVFLTVKFKRTGFIALVCLALSFAAADFISASIIKKQIQRVRPCNIPAMEKYVTERVDCGTGLSFPSSHATNHFAIAAFLSIAFYKKWKPVIWISGLWALSICFAQVYVGVHFPVDVTAGALLGAIIGSVFAAIFKRIVPVF